VPLSAKNAVSFDQLMLEMWSICKFYHFRTCWFQTWYYIFSKIIRKIFTAIFKKI